MGWYGRMVCGGAGPAAAAGERGGRHYDVVHAQSGGFLQLYLLLRTGAVRSMDTLVLDSTPIMPRPDALAAFAHGGRPLARALLLVRWAVELRLVWLAHAVRRLLRRSTPSLDAWVASGPVALAGAGRGRRSSAPRSAAASSRRRGPSACLQPGRRPPTPPTACAMAWAAEEPPRAGGDDGRPRRRFAAPQVVFGLLDGGGGP